jgi:two-component system, cell cycle sensor histidine kinase and response regulator CckA
LRRIRSTNIRGKLALVFSLLIAAISLFILLYFPARQKQQALDAVSDKAKSIAQMTAYSLSSGLYFDDYDAVKEVLESAKQNKDIIHISVLNDSNKVYFTYGVCNLTHSIQTSSDISIVRSDNTFQISCPINYSNHRIGHLILDFSLASILDEIAQSRARVTLVSLIILFIGMGAAYVFSTIITYPLSRIIETVGYVSKGDFSKRAIVSSNDEVGILAKSFNQMVENLQSARSELEDLNVTLESKVNERTQELVNEIAERTYVEEALRASEINYRAIFNAANDAIFVHDPINGAILDVNQKMCELYGYQPSEAKYLTVADISTGTDSYTQNDAMVKIEEAARGVPQLFEWIFRHKDGHFFWAEVSLRKAMIGGKERVLAVVRDIGERKKADELLRRSEEKYRSLIENISDGVLGTDFEGNIFFANSASCKLTGYDLNELQVMTFSQLIDKMDSDKFLKESENRRNGINSQYEMSVIKKDGQPCRVLISATPYLDNSGELRGSIYVCTDVTELKRVESEKQELREKLARAQRMESLGVLAGGVAHDLNNILGPLVAYPDVIRMKLPPESPALKYIGKIEQSAKRAAEVVQDLLTMARRGRYEMVPIQVNEIIESYLRSVDFANHISKHPLIEMVLGLDKTLPLINGSTSHLSKVIMNLLINAMEAMPEGGRLSVKTECRHVDRLISGFGNIEPCKYVILAISDTGVGIEQKDLKRIFEPFYSKKEMGRSGSGLGLAIVYGVIKDHNGYIDVNTEIGKGSDFLVYFPALNASVTEERQEIFDIRGSNSILVVDDGAEQRELAATTLSSLGHNVSVAANGREAVEYIKTHNVDMVILDMIMEDDFDGLDTYREIIKFRPGQKAIIASGFAETDRVKEAEKLGVKMYVRKPYTMQTLGKAIKQVLANQPSLEKVIA